MLFVGSIELRGLGRVHQFQKQIWLEFVQLKSKRLIQHELGSIKILPQCAHQLNQLLINRDPLKQRALLNLEHTVSENHRPIELIVVFLLIKHESLHKKSKLVSHVHVLRIASVVAPEVRLH